MTTYNHSIVLNDSEAIAVEEALRRYRSFCAGELADGPTAPYWAHLQSVEAVLGRLHSNSHMTSTSSFCWHKRKPE